MQIQLYQTKVFQNLCLVPTILQSDIFYIYESWACPTNGSDCGSLHSHNLTLFVILPLHKISIKFKYVTIIIAL